MNLFLFLFFLIINICVGEEDLIPTEAEQNIDSTVNANSSDSSSPGGKIIYEYKKEDYFNFEALNVKGELLSPGDLSSKATKRAKYSPSKYIRKNFDDYIVNDLLEIY